MKKRFLLLTLIMCLLGGINLKTLNAQNVVTIGEGKSTSTTAPYSTWTSRNGSQTIYSCKEINQAGTITHIAYKIKSVDGVNPYTRKIKVYLKETDIANYKDGANFVQMTTGDVKYEGDYSYTKNDEWITIELTGGGFVYSGEKNLIISIEDNTGTASYSNNGPYIDNTHFYADLFTDAMAISTDKVIDMTVSGKIGSFEFCRPQIQLTFASNGGGGDDPETTVVSPAVGTTISGTTVDLRWSYGENNTATHYQVSLGTDNGNLSVITDGWVARTELGTGGFATEDVFANVNLEYGKTYYWRVDVKNGEEGTPVEGTIWSFATPASAAFEFTTEGYWHEGANWNGGAVPGNGAIVTLNAAATITAEDNITVADLIISENASLTIEGSLTITGKFANTDASKLIIEDGGQIFQTNEGVKATFNMIINNPSDWENAQDGWQLISSPFTDASINEFTIVEEGNDYDLYKFDGSKDNEEWQNLKYQENEFETEFILTRGYLASYKETGTASITGTLNNATYLYLDKNDENNKITVTVGGNMHNFFLIGNPFPFDIDMSKMEYMQYLIEGYAILDDKGGNFQYVGTTGTIKAGDAFLIKTTGVNNNNNPILYYSHTPSKSRSENHNSINLIATGAEGSDNLIISLSGAENEGFNKLENFNKDIATVFVVKNDIRYGIANFDNDVTMIDVAFEATKMGNYTIAAQPSGKFETLTLIDRFTGIETNLLVEDYSFTAMSNENNNRFILKLAVSDQQSTVSDNFVYQSGEELIIDAEGTVQIIDMMGRVVYTSNVENNNRINVSDFNNGAYVVRVINESEIKVEKVVIY